MQVPADIWSKIQSYTIKKGRIENGTSHEIILINQTHLSYLKYDEYALTDQYEL